MRTNLVIECVDWEFPGADKRRIVVDAGERHVTFVNCLWPRRFLARGYEGYHCCGFEDIVSAREFGAGKLRRLYISTRHGRCAVSPEWTGYDELRDALQSISTVTTGGGWLDDPRVLMPAMFVVVFGIVSLVIYLLL